MILTQEIKIKTSNKNIGHYKKYFPTIKSGDIIVVNVNMLSKGSKQKIRVSCDVCKKEKDMLFKTYFRITNNMTKEYFCENCKSIKTKKTVKDKYGVDNVFQSEKIKKISKDTCNKKYNKDYYQQTDEFKEKTKNTCLNKYGVDHPLKCDEIISKMNFNLTREQINKMISTTREKYEKIFLNKANKIHDNKYNYDKANYINMITKVIIGCPIHGDFEQRPMDHLNSKQGCPICSESKGEKEIRKILKKLNIIFESQKKFCDLRYKNCLSFDFYLPDYNTCIEYDGPQHFAPYDIFGGEESFETIKKRDDLKRLYCEKNNIKLLRITYLDKEIDQIIKDFFSIKENKILRFGQFKSF